MKQVNQSLTHCVKNFKCKRTLERSCFYRDGVTITDIVSDIVNEPEVVLDKNTIVSGKRIDGLWEVVTEIYNLRITNTVGGNKVTLHIPYAKLTKRGESITSCFIEAINISFIKDREDILLTDLVTGNTKYVTKKYKDKLNDTLSLNIGAMCDNDKTTIINVLDTLLYYR